jgi:hypothetical protein
MRLIRREQPKNVQEARALGIGAMVEVGEGAFRTAYRIHGTPLLIKFPLRFRHRLQETNGGPEVWNDKEGKTHTRMEVKKIRALQKFPMFRKHLPPIYYFNGRDGVLVTKYYSGKRRIERAKSLLVSELVRTFCGVVLEDITPDNVRADRGNLMLLDLGY